MGTRVEEVMTPDPTSLSPSATVGEAYALMTGRGFRHVPVVEGDVLVGVISLTDVGHLGAKVPEILEKHLAEVMTKNVLTITPDEPVEIAAAKMASRKINCLIVMGATGGVVGIVTTYDLLDALARRIRGQETAPE